MAIIGTLPNLISDGNPIDAVPVMNDFNYIVSQVNTNAVATSTLSATTGATNVNTLAGISVQSSLTNLYSSTGASLIGYNQGATGAVTISQQAKNQQTVNVLDFGADPTGATDSTTAINAALTYLAGLGGGTIKFPLGIFTFSSTLLITTAIKFVGEGAGFVAFGTLTAKDYTTLRYIGAVNATAIKFSNINHGGAGITNMMIDCNNLANFGLTLDGLNGGYFQGVSIIKVLGTGLYMLGTTNTCSWNSFINLAVDAGSCSKAGVWLSVAGVGGNACHNSFVNLSINFGNSNTGHGLYLGGCDNNTFLMTYINSGTGGGSGYGVYVDPTEQAGFPINNTFYHLQASAKGWYQPATTTARSASIYGYMQDNSEPIPIVSANGSELLVCPDVLLPLTVTAGTGWSGGAPTFSASYIRDSKRLSIFIYISGTGVVAAANATINGLPATATVGILKGFVPSAGQSVTGYLSGGVITMSSGFASASGVVLSIDCYN